jgi:hypothetical protein
MSETRGLVIAPVAYDVSAKALWGAYRIPNATNGVKQAWDVMGTELLELDAAVSVYPTRRAIIAAFPFARRWLINVRVYLSASLDPADPVVLKQPGMVQVGEFFKVIDALGVVQARTRVGANLTVQAGDRAGVRGVDWWPVHQWAGRDDLETDTEDE